MDVTTHDCVVLSGGGAKGSYGAGVGKALSVYRDAKALTNPVCYVGASAGALNAYLLASDGPDALIRFWLEADRKKVLSTTGRGFKAASLLRAAHNSLDKTKPFSVYRNNGLRGIIQEHARLDRLKHSLIIAVTDYTDGLAKAFYSSPQISAFVANDTEAPPHKRRLQHFLPIESDAQLSNVLLASAAIPVILPPVKVATAGRTEREADSFIDGGVGNNTPTREAAYYFRFLEKLGLGKSGDVFCIRQDAPHRIAEGQDNFGPLTLLMRTFDIYNSIITASVVSAWGRINKEVEEREEKYANFERWLVEQDLAGNRAADIAARVRADFGIMGGHTARVSAPLLEIQPSIDLGDMLAFKPDRAKDNIRRGFNDTLTMLLNRGRVDDAEYRALVNTRVLPE